MWGSESERVLQEARDILKYIDSTATSQVGQPVTFEEQNRKAVLLAVPAVEFVVLE